jgi:hypothetical protein
MTETADLLVVGELLYFRQAIFSRVPSWELRYWSAGRRRLHSYLRTDGRRGKQRWRNHEVGLVEILWKVLGIELPSRYSTFCRIGTGLSYADFVGVRERKWVEWEKGKPLDFLQTAARSQDDKGDVYIRPEE